MQPVAGRGPQNVEPRREIHLLRFPGGSFGDLRCDSLRPASGVQLAGMRVGETIDDAPERNSSRDARQNAPIGARRAEDQEATRPFSGPCRALPTGCPPSPARLRSPHSPPSVDRTP
jgi:hypothetical protein